MLIRQKTPLLVRHIQAFNLRSLMVKQLEYDDYGDPLKVLCLKNVQLNDKLGPKEVRVKWKAAPINPADINQVQGMYPIRPPLPAVGGSEGVGEVDDIGDGIEGLEIGDWVIPAHSGLGCWRTHAIYGYEHLLKIDKDLSLDSAATFQANPPTAYRMLTDFVDLNPGDFVIQNGANSSVGIAVIQIAHLRNLKTINVVRERAEPAATELEARLKMLGADVVITEQKLKGVRGAFKNVRLALNCVGGRSSSMLAANLSENGVMVTYGGLSQEPIQIPTGAQIFKNIKCFGYWNSHWYTLLENKAKRDKMFQEITMWIKQGKLKPTKLETVKLENWKSAMQNALNKKHL